ncbi:hypothetical protein SWPG_00094 [Synechococcus phage S-CBM2]|nr:hypothetical protein SWPG_00094 [Synechococcus phage S-CBM2]
MTANMLGQFNTALQELVESGAWDRDVELEVKIAGTLKNDKFIVIKPVKEKMVCNPDPELKQKHLYQGENK